MLSIYNYLHYRRNIYILFYVTIVIEWIIITIDLYNIMIIIIDIYTTNTRARIYMVSDFRSFFLSFPLNNKQLQSVFCHLKRVKSCLFWGIFETLAV